MKRFSLSLIFRISLIIISAVFLMALSLWNFKFSDNLPWFYLFVQKIMLTVFPSYIYIFLFEIGLGAFLCFLRKHEKPHWDFARFARDLLTGDISDTYGIIGFIFLALLLTWFIDFLREGILSNAVLSFINILNFVQIFVLLLPLPRRYEEFSQPQPSKIVIMALSKLNVRGNIGEKEAINKIAEKIKNNEDVLELCKEGIIINWALPIKVIQHHKNKAEKFYFLISKETFEEKEHEKFKEVIKKVFPQESDDLLNKIEFSAPLDFNDYKMVKHYLEEIMKKVFRKDYSDDDISINISGGTSAVTAALTIEAVREGRQVEYFTQPECPPEYKAIDIEEEDVRRVSGKM